MQFVLQVLREMKATLANREKNTCKSLGPFSHIRNNVDNQNTIHSVEKLWSRRFFAGKHKSTWISLLLWRIYICALFRSFTYRPVFHEFFGESECFPGILEAYMAKIKFCVLRKIKLGQDCLKQALQQIENEGTSRIRFKIHHHKNLMITFWLGEYVHHKMIRSLLYISLAHRELVQLLDPTLQSKYISLRIMLPTS